MSVALSPNNARRGHSDALPAEAGRPWRVWLSRRAAGILPARLSERLGSHETAVRGDESRSGRLANSGRQGTRSTGQSRRDRQHRAASRKRNALTLIQDGAGTHEARRALTRRAQSAELMRMPWSKSSDVDRQATIRALRETEKSEEAVVKQHQQATVLSRAINQFSFARDDGFVDKLAEALFPDRDGG